MIKVLDCQPLISHCCGLSPIWGEIILCENNYQVSLQKVGGSTQVLARSLQVHEVALGFLHQPKTTDLKCVDGTLHKIQIIIITLYSLVVLGL